ncbi:MAG: hypothetical protein ACRDZR_00365 [Acidimicrobiales bacterium]
MDRESEDDAADRPERADDRIIEFGPDAGDALLASLRVFAKLGLVVSVEKVDGSTVTVVPVVVDDGQMLCAGWSRDGGRSGETVVVRIEELEGIRVL